MRTHRLAVNAMFFVNGFIYANWVARLPRIQEMYGLDHGGTGLILLVAAIGALLAMPFTGWLIMRTGSDKVTTLAAFLFLVWVALIPLAPGFVVLGVVFFGLGVASGILKARGRHHPVEHCSKTSVSS